ncbi:MAG: hypothetical protein E2P02_20415 [Acidobacteria bacterium]|nr:MAG: hypothetical protein E2P02_20415 [Acidobacteriota bacterium]
MSVRRWFEATFLEAEQSTAGVDFTHLGAQFALRIEEVVRPRELKQWWSLTSEWTDPKAVEPNRLGDMESKILSFLEQECSACMARVPDDKRADFLRGVWAKRD